MIGITKPLRPLFPISGDDPALISFYFGDDDEDSTLKGAKEQPDEPAVISVPRRSLEDRTGLIDREHASEVVTFLTQDISSRCVAAVAQLLSVFLAKGSLFLLFLRIFACLEADAWERLRSQSPYLLSSSFLPSPRGAKAGHR